MSDHPRRATSQWEGTPRALIASLCIALIVLALGYWVAVPVAARVIAYRVPAVVATEVSEGVLNALDSELFEPTAVPEARQQALVSGFRRLDLHGQAAMAGTRILFRSSPSLGPNAMALPAGTIVVTDQLVAIVRDDQEILGVLAHEAGHIEYRHGLRLVLQNSLVAVLIAWAVGDFSSLMAGAPTALLQAKYSRDLEREADSYAIQTLRANGISTRHLASMLERLEAAARERSGEQWSFDYLSSHPATAERLERLRAE